MKIYIYIVLALAVVGALVGGGFALHHSWYSEGYNARIVQEATATANATRHAEARAAKQSVTDTTSAAALARTVTADNTIASGFQEAINVVPLTIPQLQAPGAPVAISAAPIPFSDAFIVCWNAASRDSSAGLSACQAYGSDAAMRPVLKPVATKPWATPERAADQAPGAGTCTRRGQVFPVQPRSGC